MIEAGISKRVKIGLLIESQLPSYVTTENPKTVSFLKQYYLSQDSQGGVSDIIENLDQYLKFDNLTPDVIRGTTTLTANITAEETSIAVDSIRGLPQKDGLIKIDNEIIYYTEISGTTLTGCARGFSGIIDYKKGEVVFSNSSASSHSSGVTVTNLSVLFLKEFFRHLKVSFAPGFEDESFVEDLNVNNFVKNLQSFYNSKGTEDSFRILISALYGKAAKIKNQADLLLEPSAANFKKRITLVCEKVSGDPLKLSGRTLLQDANPNNSEVEGASAPISEVEFVTKRGRPYYNVFLFDRFNDPAVGFEGTFIATAKTAVIGDQPVGSSVITVDTTIGFPKSGLLISGNNIITYTDKTINQFLNCSGVTEEISSTSEIRTNDIVYSFDEDGNKVEMKLTNVIRSFTKKGDVFYNDDDEVFRVKTIGKKIKNPTKNKTIEQIKFNSWVYNTASTINVKSFSGSTFVLEKTIDKAFLRNGDTVEIINSGDNSIVVPSATVSVSASNVVILSAAEITDLIPGVKYKIRRRLKKSTTTNIDLEFGNNLLTSDVQNTYIDETDENLYVASSSLPSYNINVRYTEAILPNVSVVNGTIQDQVSGTDSYNVLSFEDNVPFVTGDEIVYQAGTATEPIGGLEFGRVYYVQVINYSNKIKLFLARSFIDTGENIKLEIPTTSGTHKFVISEQSNKKLSPQKILKKFPIQSRVDTGAVVETVAGTTGMLINGVEIVNYKTDDKIFFGPLKEISIVSPGSGYDVINPPGASITAPQVSGGTTALANFAVRGELKNILIDPQDFDIEKVLDIKVSGGNGTGALVEPVVIDYFRTIQFQSKLEEDGGGIIYGEGSKITTVKNHNLGNGQPISYSPKSNPPIPIAGYGVTTITGRFLETGGVYYPNILSPNSFELYETLGDLNSGINTIGITTGTFGGFHEFTTLNSTKKIVSVNVLNPGSGYENRKVAISTSGISTATNSFKFTNHGYNSGELVTYTSTDTPITGIDTTNQYYIIKIDENNFRIANAGVGGTDTTDYNRGLFKKIEDLGSGYHTFNYPPITVDVNVSIANTVGVVTATAIVKGSIVDALIYENGTSYGTDILNFHKKPTVNIINGKGAQFEPSIVNGKITQVVVSDAGQDYNSVPDLVVTSPTGSGAILRAVVSNRRISRVVVINGGINYNIKDTKITAVSRGTGASVTPQVRDLTINRNFKFASNDGVILLNRGEDVGLQYAISGYGQDISAQFSDTNSNVHSPLIGWAYDGNPIYGIYAYADPNDTTSDIRKIISSYELDTTQITNRPSGFPSGIFVEDYSFKGTGDLDEFNGRFTKTPEFPKGTYAYYALVDTDPSTGDLTPKFPYFVGDSYKSNIIPENLSGQETSLSQEFDFNNSGLIRNTFPYSVSEENADYDFYVEPYELDNQRIIVEQVNTGGVESVGVIESGDNYKVGDKIEFTQSESGGGGAEAEISEILGKNVTSIVDNSISYDDITFVKTGDTEVTGFIGTFHSLSDNDIVTISGLSTFVRDLAGSHDISVKTEKTVLKGDMPPESVGGMTTDIPITPIPEFLKANGRISIGSGDDIENLTVLNVFKPNNIADRFIGVIRAKRGTTTGGHSTGDIIDIKPNSFSINLDSNPFVSKSPEVSYFNPTETVGTGTFVGLSTNKEYTVLGFTTIRDVLTQSIHLENHNFKSNQKALLEKPSGTNSFVVSSDVGLTTFFVPAEGEDSQLVYITNKGKNIVGVKTTLDSEELIFHTDGSNNHEYRFTSQPNKVTGNVKRLTAEITSPAAHGLTRGDDVDITVKPNLNVGIGTSTAIRVIYQSDIQNIVVDPVGFTSSSVGISSSKFTVSDHGFVTGDLVYYSASEVPSGINTGKYYIYRIDNNNFSLVETRNDLLESTIQTVSFTSIGGTSHTVSKVNPELKIIKNNNVVFDVSDTSLFGYDFNLYLDSAFRNEFIGTGNTDIFQVQKSGTVGLGTTATVTLTYTEDLPNEFFYNLEKSGSLVESDITALNYSKLSFVNSEYNLKTKVVGAAYSTLSFTVRLEKEPERVSYAKTECDELRYTTRSSSAIGGISKVRVTNPGDSYRKIPGISSVTSDEGVNSELFVESKTIASLGSVVIEKPGFDFSQDKTLRPIADIPTYYGVENSNKIKSIIPLFGGKNFITPPDLIVINSVTKEEITDAEIIPVMGSGSIESVQLISSPSGLAGVGHSVYTISNSNGISIIKVDSVNTGIVTATLRTPLLGFTTSPFKAGDKIFVDGIQTYNDEGDGFNSRNYGFTFFEVQSFNGGINPSTVTFDLNDFTSNAGIAVTDVIFGNVTKFENYPTFEVILEKDTFIDNERLQVKTSNGFVDTDLIVTKSDESILKTFGDYELVVGDQVFGVVSGTKATIQRIQRFEGFYEVGYGINQNFGWSDETGFLNTDYQVIPDNDYYQKLSYSISSPLEFEEFSGPVNRLAHISGTKNFADTEILSTGIGLSTKSSETNQVTVIDFIDEVDTATIRNFDFGVDLDVVENSTNAIGFGQKKLSTYIECITNRVLQIDDISSEFIDSENIVGNYKDILVFPPSAGTNRLYILVTDVLDQTHYQIYEIVITTDGDSNSFLLEKSRVKSPGSLPMTDEEKESIGEITAVYETLTQNIRVRFTPTEASKTYDIKIFRQLFDSRNVGFGSFAVGDSKLFGNSTEVGIGSTSTVIGLGVSEFNSIMAYCEVSDTVTGEKDYAEIALLHDGINAYMSEYGFSTNDRELLSFDPIGTFGASLENDVLSLNFTNNGDVLSRVKVNAVGFQTTNVGLSSYHFKIAGQENGSERTARIESNVVEEVVAGYGITVVGLTTIIDRFAKSLVRVSLGNTQSMSQTLFSIDNGLDATIVQEYPQTGINTSIGLGTFTSEITGSFANLLFKPDPIHNGQEIRIEQFSEIVYKDRDTNITAISDLPYGVTIKENAESRYTPNSKTDFELKYNGYPIFARRFNPNTPSVLNLSTGELTIKSHFLNTAQELVYEPGSTITGVASGSIGIGLTLSGGTSFIGDSVIDSKIVSAASTGTDINVGDEIIGVTVSSGATVVSIGSTFRFFFGDTDGTQVISGVANTSVLAIGDTIRELVTETGFGTITSIGENTITVENNVPVGVGSTYYSERLGIAVSMSSVALASTVRQTYTTGISTDILPRTLYAIVVDQDTIKLASKKDFANSGISVTPTSRGSGNNHLIDTTKKLSKTLITIDGVVQDPISKSNIDYVLEENIGVARTFFAISGISTINPNDILKVNDEYMFVRNIGFATTATGPISGVGTFSVVNVDRAFVGTKAAEHNNQDSVDLYRGSYNVVESSIHFVSPPKGAGSDFLTDERNLFYTRSGFSGRAYLRLDYGTNELYDDISPQFTGIGKTFTLTVDGDYPVGLETASGSGVLFINGIYQGQTTANNPLNVYEVGSSNGDVTIEFSGTKLISGDSYLSDEDVNSNKLPKGGVIVSIAATGGKGIAPLVGASVRADVDASGSITNIVGVETVGSYSTITNFIYTPTSGIATVTTQDAHGYKIGNFVSMRDIEFDCTSGYDSLVGISTLIYDNVSGIMTVTTKTDHFLNKDMQVKFRNLKFECTKGFDNLLGVSTANYDHLSGIITVTTNSAHDLNRNMKVKFHDLKFECTKEFLPTVGIYTADYDNVSGIITVSTIGDHKLNRNMKVKFYDLEMECQKGFDTYLGISSHQYDHVSGILTVTTSTDHLLNKGMSVRLENLEFACSDEHSGVTTTFFPDGTNGRIFNIVTSRNSATEFETEVGVTTIPHIPVGDGGTVETGITTTKFPSKAGIQYGIIGFDYTESTGIGTITVNRNHNITVGETVDIRNIEFTCAAEHAGVTTTVFPDGTQGFEYEVLAVPSATELRVNVGISTIAHTYDSGGFVSGVKYVEAYTVTNVGSGTEFTAQIDTVGFAHTYIGGGLVQSGVTTNVFPSSEGRQFAITNFVYDNTTGDSTVTLSGDHDIPVGVDVKLEDIEFDCLSGARTFEISNFEYTESTGLSTVTVSSAIENLQVSDVIRLDNIEFTCSSEHAGVTTTFFPDGTQGFDFTVTQVNSTTEFELNVGVSTIAHVYSSGGKVFVGVTTTVFPDGTQGDTFKVTGVGASTININVGISTIAHTYSAHGILSEVQYDEGFNVTKVNSTTEFEAQIPTVGFAHTYVAYSGGTVETGITTNIFPSDLGIEWAISGFDYTESLGVGTITTKKTHNITTGEYVRLKDIEFKCLSGARTYEITGFDYTESTGLSTVTVSSTITDLTVGDEIRLDNIAFTCAVEHAGVTTTIFPDGTQGFDYEVTQINSGTEFEINVGISTIAHTYDTGGKVFVGLTTTIFPDTIIDEFEVLDVPSATEIEINVGVSTIAHEYSAHGVVAGVKYVGGYTVGSVIDSKNFTVDVLPVGFAHTYVPNSGGVVETGFTTDRFPDNRGIPFAIDNFEYDKTTGLSTITTKKNHSGIVVGDVINLSGIAMTCLAYDNEIAITNFEYDASTGLSTVTVASDHGLSTSDLVMLRDIEFTCAAPHAGVTTTIFPDGTQGYIFDVDTVPTSTSFTTNVGISTIAHTYDTGGKIRIGITTSVFPDGTQGFEYSVISIPAPNKIITNVGISTIDHIYDDHGIVYGVKYANPYSIRTIIDENRFEVDVLKVGFAHTYVPSRRRGVPSGEVAEYYAGLTFGSGYFQDIVVSVEEEGHEGTDATITATAGAGGTAIFSITAAGTGYTNPTINVEDPTYSNLSVEGVYRVSVGETTESGSAAKLSITVGQASTTGIGSTTFEVKNARLTANGFAYRIGDKFKPVGLVTALGVGDIHEDLIVEVTDIVVDTFSSWNFGQVDYIDSIKSLQNGVRSRFPLNLNGSSLSFQKNVLDENSAAIDLDAVLLVFVNGVVQTPEKDYFFDGGTSFNFNFTSPPRQDDDVAIYFYRGTKGIDSKIVTVYETLKPGDKLQLQSERVNNIKQQDPRLLAAIVESEEVETNIYRGQGINEVTYRPLDVTKQKRDLIIFEEIVTKDRDSLTAQIKPVARVIKDFTSSDTEIFLDDADFFQYEENAPGSNLSEVTTSALIVDYIDEPIAAAVTATVSETGTITALTIVDGGSGYLDGSVNIAIAKPVQVDDAFFNIVGVGSTAVISATASGGEVTSVTIDSPGFGYTNANPPQVIVEVPTAIVDSISEADVILGYSGIITGIGTTTGTDSHPLAIKFDVDLSKSGAPSVLATLKSGYPIYVKNTTTGTGVTSVDTSDSEVISISTSFVDNIYIMNDFTFDGNVGVMTCNIKSDTDTSGISSTGVDIGSFSWGRLSGFTRGDSPISLTVSGKTYNSGLSTYPTIVRNKGGLRETGAIARIVSL